MIKPGDTCFVSRTLEGTSESGQLFLGRTVTISKDNFTEKNRADRSVSAYVTDLNGSRHSVYIPLCDLRMDAPAHDYGEDTHWTLTSPKFIVVSSNFD